MNDNEMLYNDFGKWLENHGVDLEEHDFGKYHAWIDMNELKAGFLGSIDSCVVPQEVEVRKRIRETLVDGHPRNLWRSVDNDMHPQDNYEDDLVRLMSDAVKAAYRSGWYDRESDFINGRDRLIPVDLPINNKTEGEHEDE